MLKEKITNFQNNKIIFQDSLIILCLLSFFFLWDIKLNLFEIYILSLREIFYLLFLYLLLDYKKLLKIKSIKYLFIFFIFLLYNFYNFEFNFKILNINYNIISILFLFLIFLICNTYKKELLNKLHITFIIFIYIFLFSFFFSDIYDLSINEKSRLCGIVDFTIINQHIFLETSHLGMVLTPFYYFIFKVNKINIYQKLVLLLFQIFIFIFFYSVTLLFSTLISFFIMLVIDYRFFLRNKLFFLCQFSILIVPFFLNSCFYKVSHTFENLSNISDSSNGKGFESNVEKLKIDKKFLDLTKIDELNILDLTNVDEPNILDITKIDKLNISTQIVQVTNIIDKITEIMREIELDGIDVVSTLNKEGIINNEKIKYDELYKKKYQFIELRKNLHKKKIAQQLENFSAAEINYLIKKNVTKFPIENKSKINDHTTAVLLNALNVAFLSIKEKPLGWGFNNYQMAFNKYMLEAITPPFFEIYYLNYNDGSNNSIKLFVEFGIFSFLIFFNLLYFILNKNIPVSQRILFGGIIITQLARAAGYFNGGFVLCIIFTFILNYQSFKKNDYEKTEK